MSKRYKRILLAGCGSGGHVLPMKQVGLWLESQGHKIFYISGIRGWSYLKDIPDDKKRLMPWPYMGSRWTWFTKIIPLIKGIGTLNQCIEKFQPQALWSFGGHVGLVSMAILAALKKLPFYMYHADPSANLHLKFLEKRAKHIALGPQFGLEKGLTLHSPSTSVGWPLKSQFDVFSPYPFIPESFSKIHPLTFLVLGGSQGSYFWSVVPHAIALLAPEEQVCIKIFHQSRQEQFKDLSLKYEKTLSSWEGFVFRNDIECFIQQSHVVLTRAGASTLAEIQAMGRPGYVVPIPFLSHQIVNATLYAQRGGGWHVPQSLCTPYNVSLWIRSLLNFPQILKNHAAHAYDSWCQGGTHRLGTLMIDLLENP